MTVVYFLSHFPYEESCKQEFKAYRDQVGVVCPKCNGGLIITLEKGQGTI